MSLYQIKEAVEEQLKIRLESRTRDRKHADGRAMYYQLSRELTHHTLASIGKAVDRDHSSVIHGLNNIFLHVDSDLYYRLKTELIQLREQSTNIIRARYDNIIVTNKNNNYEN